MLNSADADTSNEAVKVRLHNSDFLNASSWIVGSPEPSGWKSQTSPNLKPVKPGFRRVRTE
ncbi:hypothetical protein EV580_5988 [Mycobacterium sp. BK086]|nr:hypothetical protein EV580_5988 [Mycobacterium sp. BK086]